MSRKIQNECKKHLIMNKQYCIRCGTLYYKGVRKTNNLFIPIKL